MQSNTADFINLTAFAKAMADHLKGSLNDASTTKRVFNLDEATAYCRLTCDSGGEKHFQRERRGTL
jgi:hypothetical protein